MEHLPPTDPPDSGWVNAADGTPILRYELESGGRVLHVEWQAETRLEAVKAGFQLIGRLLRVHGCPVVLSDSINNAGDWSELIPWVRYDFLPTALASGLRYLVDVLPLDPANSFSVYRWREETKGLLHHGVFNNLNAARAWVQQRLQADDASAS